jgi:serine/threonine protein kinase
MPSPTTIDELLELVRKSEVVDDKKFTTYLDKVRAAQTLPNTPAALAGLMVRDGLLTQFQAEQFLQGKWRRFCLGKYKVLERLGAGGMGTVFLCEHKLMRRRVAVKVLPEARAEDASSLDRFYREARIVAALDHPNIVRAYDIDQDGKLHFLVMEHVDGASLQEIVKKTGPMDVLRACHYIRQAALGLQHAHDTAGIVHRDIKPSNILVDRNGIVKVLDMGLARFFYDEEDDLTKKHDENVLGTADYLAPEQALDSHAADIRADIYSLGATFYFCLTGRTPFADGSVAQKLIWHQTRQPKPIRQLRPGVPEGVIALVEKMMAKDANQRPQTPQEVAQMLTPWTQTPIPPPPENEMPQLSPAAMGTAPSDSSMPPGPKPPPNGSDFSPTPRKVWQVSQSSTPTPPTMTPQSPKPPPLPNDLRKTDPPRGQLNLELTPSAPPSPPPRGGGTKGGAVAAPQLAAVVAPPVRSQAELGNEKKGNEKKAVNAEKPAATPSPKMGTVLPPLQPEKTPSWEELLLDEDASTAVVVPRHARRNPVSVARRVGGLPPDAGPGRLGWIIGGAAVIVLGLILVAAFFSWVTSSERNDPPPARVGPAVFYVNPRGDNNACKSIDEALKNLRKSRQAARIIVQDDVAESDLLVDVLNVSIEAEEGKIIHWRPSAKPDANKLLRISNAENVRIRGFVLDGGNRLDMLVNLYLRCPGAKLENLKLQGFKKYGIRVTNCEGEAQLPIEFNRLEFFTSQKDQAAVFFSADLNVVVRKNRYFAFHDCTFAGRGTKVKTTNPATLENIDWPPNVQPVQGQ